jgi:hypothetical protein
MNLDPAREKEFRDYCHSNNPNYAEWESYHPVCRDEWTKMGKGPVSQAQLDAEEVDTRKHIDRVRHFLTRFAAALLKRAELHDASKLTMDELPYFARANAGGFLGKTPYKSPEYQKRIKECLGPALAHHYRCNSHHPQHFGDMGMYGMDLLDLVEMFCDWCAATERHPDGSIMESIKINSDPDRFDIPEMLVSILEHSAEQLSDDPDDIYDGEW